MGGTVEHLPNLNGYNARGVKWQKFTTKLNIIRKFMNDGQRPKSLPTISQGQQGFSQSRSTILRYSNSDEKKIWTQCCSFFGLFTSVWISG